MKSWFEIVINKHKDKDNTKELIKIVNILKEEVGTGEFDLSELEYNIVLAYAHILCILYKREIVWGDWKYKNLGYFFSSLVSGDDISRLNSLAKNTKNISFYEALPEKVIVDKLENASILLNIVYDIEVIRDLTWALNFLNKKFIKKDSRELFVNYLFKNTDGFSLKESPEDKWDCLFLMLVEFLSSNSREIKNIKITKKDGKITTYDKNENTIQEYSDFLNREMKFDIINGFVEKDNFKLAEIYYLSKKAIITRENDNWEVKIIETTTKKLDITLTYEELTNLLDIMEDGLASKKNKSEDIREQQRMYFALVDLWGDNAANEEGDNEK